MSLRTEVSFNYGSYPHDEGASPYETLEHCLKGDLIYGTKKGERLAKRIAEALLIAKSFPEIEGRFRKLLSGGTAIKIQCIPDDSVEIDFRETNRMQLTDNKVFAQRADSCHYFMLHQVLLFLMRASGEDSASFDECSPGLRVEFGESDLNCVSLLPHAGSS